jgi:hypothetical protein
VKIFSGGEPALLARFLGTEVPWNDACLRRAR